MIETIKKIVKALEVAEDSVGDLKSIEIVRSAIASGRQAIAEAEKQEPVAWMHPDGRIWTFGRGFDKSTFTIPLYTQPQPKREWVGLTPEERLIIIDQWHWDEGKTDYLCRLVEEKLKEKNT